MTATKAELKRREELAEVAGRQVFRAILTAAEQTGEEIITRQAIRGRPEFGTMRDVSPADGLMAARAIEREARKMLLDYIRAARESGMGWKAIGEVLNLGPQGRREDISVAVAAFNLAAPEESYWALTYGRSFRWDCPDCGQKIEDEGPEFWPGEFRHGHGKGCKRLASEARAYGREMAGQ